MIRRQQTTYVVVSLAIFYVFSLPCTMDELPWSSFGDASTSLSIIVNLWSVDIAFFLKRKAQICRFSDRGACFSRGRASERYGARSARLCMVCSGELVQVCNFYLHIGATTARSQFHVKEGGADPCEQRGFWKFRK